MVGIGAATTDQDSIITSYRDHCTHLVKGGSLLEVCEPHLPFTSPCCASCTDGVRCFVVSVRSSPDGTAQCQQRLVLTPGACQLRHDTRVVRTAARGRRSWQSSWGGSMVHQRAKAAPCICTAR